VDSWKLCCCVPLGVMSHLSVPSCVEISKLRLKVKMVDMQTAWQCCDSSNLPLEEGKYDKIGFD
jgi:hypothetical protein